MTLTPKEKAEELYDKFNDATVAYDCGDYTANGIKKSMLVMDEQNKKCALIAIEEAEKSEYNVLIKFGFVTENYKSDYWQEVKNELLKQQNNG